MLSTVTVTKGLLALNNLQKIRDGEPLVVSLDRKTISLLNLMMKISFLKNLVVGVAKFFFAALHFEAERRIL